MERTKPATASVILARLTIPSKINRLSAKSKRMTIAYGNPGFPLDGSLTQFLSIRLLRKCANACPILPRLSSLFLSTDRTPVVPANAFADSCFSRLAITSLKRRLEGQLRGASLICPSRRKTWMCLDTTPRAGLKHQSRRLRSRELSQLSDTGRRIAR